MGLQAICLFGCAGVPIENMAAGNCHFMLRKHPHFEYEMTVVRELFSYIPHSKTYIPVNTRYTGIYT
jgi:hypothetical protein